MYYRRKILLSLLSAVGGEVSKIKLQKLLFLFTQEQETPTFHFVPYKFGCYSFQANADLKTMIKYSLVDGDEVNWKLHTNKNYIKELKNDDRIFLSRIIARYGSWGADELIDFTYKKYPYFAIKSTIAEEKLNQEDYSCVLDAMPKGADNVLYTIGYEGVTLEEYLLKLLDNDVKVLLDVRNYPRSMKFGFSKNQLMKSCIGLGIVYVHLPNLGIVSDKRKSLNSQKDYDELFIDYTNTVLKENIEDQEKVLELLKSHNRVALTCFEKNIKQCHRTHLAKSISKLPDWNYSIKHI